MSTCAITVSLTTAVTMPRSRLRAEESSEPAPGSPSLRAREPGQVDPVDHPVPVLIAARAASRPASTQRRTVSTLTPSSSAASPIRNIVTPSTLAVRICGGKQVILLADAAHLARKMT
nr:hypothetical protein GCM10020092_025780 [Actinoplanes digitatis]